MDCPFCPGCTEYSTRPRVRVSIWAPLAIIAAVLGAAALASSMADLRDPVARQGVVASHGRAL